MKASRSRERPEKILVAMSKLSGGTTKSLKYEDIVVEAFRMFPDEFALRGYKEYPDSSDIHKPLYGVLKRAGMIRAANKAFALTQLGVERARQLTSAAGGRLDEERDARRMTRDVILEVERMLGSDAFHMFRDGKGERILDTDFFAFIGCTVRTQRNDFLGRVAATDAAVKAAKALGQPDKESARALAEAWKFITKQHGGLIQRRKEGL